MLNTKFSVQNAVQIRLLVCLESNPIIFKCKGCSRYVVICNDQAYTISEEFFLKTAKSLNLKYCGQITQTTKRDLKSVKKAVKKNEITEDDLKQLHQFLEKTLDSADIIKKL